MDNKNSVKGFCYIIIAVCIWAGWIVASRYGVKGQLSAYDITAIRFTTAGVLLIPVIMKKGFKLGPWGVASAFLLSLLMGAGYNAIALTGMKMAPASHASTIINGTVLLFTTVAALLMREPFSRLRLMGIAVTVAGIVTILLSKTGTSDPEFAMGWLGHICFIIAGCMWGCYIMLAKKWNVTPLHATAVVSVLSMLYYMPFYLCLAKSHISLSTINAVLFQAVYQGIFTAIIAFLLFNKGIMLIGATRASSFIPLVPVIATIIAIPILHEMPSAYEWGGVFAVSIGVLFASGVLKT